MARLGTKGWETCPPQSPTGQTGIRGNLECPEDVHVEQTYQRKREEKARGQPGVRGQPEKAQDEAENRLRMELPSQWRELMGTPLCPTDHPDHSQGNTFHLPDRTE